MKKYFLMTAALASVATTALADSYVGVVRSKGQMGLNCGQADDCKRNAELMKFYAGTKLSSSDQIDLAGVAKVDAVEIAYWRGFKAAANGSVGVTSQDDDVYVILASDPNNPNRVPSKLSLGFDAFILAGVARAPINEDFSLVAKAGVAYVSATKKLVLNNQSNRSTTANKFKPYLGFGADYKVLPNVRVGAQLDLSAFEVAGDKGVIKSLGLSAEMDY